MRDLLLCRGHSEGCGEHVELVGRVVDLREDGVLRVGTVREAHRPSTEQAHSAAFTRSLLDARSLWMQAGARNPKAA